MNVSSLNIWLTFDSPPHFECAVVGVFNARSHTHPHPHCNEYFPLELYETQFNKCLLSAHHARGTIRRARWLLRLSSPPGCFITLQSCAYGCQILQREGKGVMNTCPNSPSFCPRLALLLGQVESPETSLWDSSWSRLATLMT